MTALIKEVCVHCAGSVNLGQSINECNICDCVIHTKCFDKKVYTFFENNFYCKNCDHKAVIRYNPFKEDLENDEIDGNDDIFSFSQIMSSCKAHKVNEINNSHADIMKDHMSIFFQNIDGAKSNFDALASSFKRNKSPKRVK